MGPPCTLLMDIMGGGTRTVLARQQEPELSPPLFVVECLCYPISICIGGTSAAKYFEHRKCRPFNVILWRALHLTQHVGLIMILIHCSKNCST